MGSAAKIDHKLVDRLRDAGANAEWSRPPRWYTLDKTRNSNQIFPAMLEGIKSAQHSIDFSTYIYWTGGPTIDAFGDAPTTACIAGC